MAVDGGSADLIHAVALLGAAVVSVPIFKRTGLGAVIGYLAAGIAIGPFGIRILQRLMKDAPRFLRSGGWLGLEVGLGQGPAVQQWLARTGQFAAPEAVLDDHGQVRSLLAQRL